MTVASFIRTELFRAGPTPWLLGLVALCHGLVYSVMLGPWMGEDEPWQLENAIVISEGHLPTAPLHFGPEEMLDAPLSHLTVRRAFGSLSLQEAGEIESEIIGSMGREGWFRRVDFAPRSSAIESYDEILTGSTAANHPKLYYLVVGGLLAPFRGTSIETRLTIARGLSLVLFVGTVLLAFGAARRALPRGPGAAVAGLFMALWPMSARSAAVVNNDVLARFFVALALYFAVRWVTPESDGDGSGRRRWMLPAALLATCILALLTKTTGAAAGIAAVAACLVHPRALRSVGRSLALVGGLAAIGAGAIASYVAGFNPAVTFNLIELAKRFEEGIAIANLAKLRNTLVGSFGWESRAHDLWLTGPIGWSLLVLTVLGGLAVLRRSTDAQRRVLVVCALMACGQLLLVILRGRHGGVGRYLMPTAPAFAILIGAGVSLWLPMVARRVAAAGAALLLGAFSAYFLWQGLGYHEWLEWGW